MLAWDSALVTRGCRGRGRVPLGLRQVPHRLSVRWILDTVMMAVQLLLSRRCWLVLASAARCMCLNLQQVGSVLALPFRVVDGRVCLQVPQLAWSCRLRFCLRSCVPVVHSCGSAGVAAAAAGVGGAAPSAELRSGVLFSVNGGVTPDCPPAQSCRSGLVCASALAFVLNSVGISVHWCISNLPETRALLQ